MRQGINKVCLLGNIGKDPEIRTTSFSKKMALFSLATPETWKDKASGEKKTESEWHRVVVMDENLVNIVESYCPSGTLLYLEGKLKTRKWTDKNGKDQYTTEVVLPSYGSKLLIIPTSGKNQNAETERDGFTAAKGFNEFDNFALDDTIDEDLPF